MKFLFLCVPFLLAMTFDATFTLQGQIDFQNPNEGNPVMYKILKYGPVVAIHAFVLYATLVCTIIMFLNEDSASIVAITVADGHVLGAQSWCTDYSAITLSVWAFFFIATSVLYWRLKP